MCNGGSYSFEMRKIRRYNEWQSVPYHEQKLYEEFELIKIMSNNAGIPNMIIHDALKYHKKISDYNITYRGLKRVGIIAASLYISCIKNKYPRTPKEIANIFNLDVYSTTKGCKNAISILNILEKDMNNDDKTIFINTTSESFIERYCSKLSINEELTKLCLFICKKIETNNIMPENTPPSIASGVVFFVCQICNISISKKDIQHISEISQVTINKCFKKLEKIQEQLVPEVIYKKYGLGRI